MKKLFLSILSLVLIICFLSTSVYPSETVKEDSFFKTSLHYTTRGMAYWYSKTNGGLEALTGIPYESSKLDCLNCHVNSCDRCHKIQVNNKFFYSTKSAKEQEICLSCHKREKAIKNIDMIANKQDIHISKGMQCMDCHTSRDIHGDGIRYESMKQLGALDPKCETCHDSINPTTSHKIHKEKLDCKACHVRHVVSCSNCHFGMLVDKQKRVDIKLSNWLFLMNYNGKVTSANMQNFVVPDNEGFKTFILFAPQNSHSIMKEGRKCNGCHGTDIVKEIQKGKITITWVEDGETKNINGVIPVVDDVEYETVYQDYKDGKWIVIKNSPKAMLQYAGYGSPLTPEQLRKMAIPMNR